MKFSQLAGFCFGSLWIVACATAQDGGVNGDGSAGTSFGGSAVSSSGGQTNTGGSTSTGTSGSTASGGSSNTFGGSAGLSGSSGLAGTSSASGSTGLGGLGNGGASGAGTSGSGGAGGSAGNAAGSGGSGGAPAVFETGECAASPTVALSYMTPAASQSITAHYQFANTSDTPIPVAELTVRYYFSNEEIGGWTPHVYSSRIDGAGKNVDMSADTTLNIVKLAQAGDGADSYVEIGFTSLDTLPKGATASVSWDLQPAVYNPPPAQVQSNDFSYNAADSMNTPWDHIAIYQGDALVGGCIPKPVGGGTGGAGGTGGTGGTGGGAAGSAGTAGSAGAAGTSAGAGTGGSAGATSGGAGGSGAGTGGTSAAGSGGAAGATGGTAGSGGTATAGAGGTAGTGI